MAGGRELGHVPAGFGEEHLSHGPGEARMLISKPQGRAERLHRFVDAGREPRDVGGVGVDAVQEQPRHECVVRGLRT